MSSNKFSCKVFTLGRMKFYGREKFYSDIVRKEIRIVFYFVENHKIYAKKVRNIAYKYKKFGWEKAYEVYKTEIHYFDIYFSGLYDSKYLKLVLISYTVLHQFLVYIRF